MAVQKNKKSRSRRDMRRSHDALTTSTLSIDKTSGENSSSPIMLVLMVTTKVKK